MSLNGTQKLNTSRELFLYYHGIGDSLLFNTVLFHLGREKQQRFLVGSKHPEIYRGNPYVRHLPFKHQAMTYKAALAMRLLHLVGAVTHMNYYHAGRIPQKHIMHLLADRMGLKQPPTKPLIFLSETELKEKILPTSRKPWLSIQSTGNTQWTDNKNWGAARFEQLARLLAPSFSLVQIGNAGDPPLPVEMNLCGKIGVRQVFQVLRQCVLFVGQVGFLMHAASAVDVPSVIIYGGFEAPWQSGYDGNANLYSAVECAPCWLESKCPYDKKCMAEIMPEKVVNAVHEKLNC